jgi:chromosome segregation ATPase
VSDIVERLRVMDAEQDSSHLRLDAIDEITRLTREVEKSHQQHSECIDYYEAKLVEVERKLDEYSSENERLRELLREARTKLAAPFITRARTDFALNLLPRIDAALAGEPATEPAKTAVQPKPEPAEVKP